MSVETLAIATTTFASKRDDYTSNWNECTMNTRKIGLCHFRLSVRIQKKKQKLIVRLFLNGCVDAGNSLPLQQRTRKHISQHSKMCGVFANTRTYHIMCTLRMEFIHSDFFSTYAKQKRVKMQQTNFFSRSESAIEQKGNFVWNSVCTRD